MLRAFAGSARRLGGSAATYARALAWATLPVTTVVVVDDGSPAGDALFRTALRTYRPRTVPRRMAAGGVDGALLPPELAAMVTSAAPRAYVCAGRTCAAPVTAPDALHDVLLSLKG